MHNETYNINVACFCNENFTKSLEEIKSFFGFNLISKNINNKDLIDGKFNAIIVELENEKKIEILTKYSINDAKGNEKIESVQIKHEEGQIKTINADYVLGFFGLIMQLGPIANWGLNINKKTIEVDTEKFETNQKGIYAIGDICSYPGKLKLILSGFHEGALAARACFKLARPNEKYRFEFTTSSKSIKNRLGVKSD